MAIRLTNLPLILGIAAAPFLLSSCGEKPRAPETPPPPMQITVLGKTYDRGAAGSGAGSQTMVPPAKAP